MQKLIAKYGLAAHLAILAVAPLFLFPFFAGETIAEVLLWLSLAAAGWLVLEPSVLVGERLADARVRVAKAIALDPLFWALLFVTGLAGFRALNSGVSLSYDAESGVWRLASAMFPILPGSVGSSGFLPFAAVLALGVLTEGMRHALGRAARTAFLLLSTSFAGAAAVLLHVAVFFKVPVPDVGFVFGVYLLAGVVALTSVMETGWYAALPWMILAIGGSGAALFSFSSVLVTLSFGGAFVLLLVYALVYSAHFLQSSGEFKQLLLIITSFVLGALLVYALLPTELLDARLAPYSSLTVFSEDYRKVSEILERISIKTWIAHLWVGTGVSSFALDFRFLALPEEWVVLPGGPVSVTNGWCVLLAERGVVGAVVFLAVGFFFVATYVRRLVEFFRVPELPHPGCLLLPFLIGLFVAMAFFDGSPLRVESLMATSVLLAVSAASFLKRKG